MAGFRRLPPPLVMPGLEPGIQAAASVIIRGHRPWIHWSSGFGVTVIAQSSR
jgi:hypothetical protein